MLARVQDEYLTESEIKESIPSGISARDSLTMARSLINKWIKKTILLKKAKENLSNEELNFEEQINDYRNSLIIYKYESSLVKQKVDTVVKEQEIKTYYENNTSNFRLKDDVLKIHYVLLPLGYENTNEVRRIFFNEDNTGTIKSYCKKHNLKYYLDDEWMYFNEVRNYLPLKAKKAGDIEYRKNEIKDSEHQYFLKILDVRGINDTKPLSLVKNDIKSIIINQRKTRLKKQMHQDLVSEGFKKNEIETY
ncbi:MAG: hypothetical protein K9J27_06195 [Bacteroidales bacterium]|nr:hypothetical protein [Bacteroidales bacterium]MCF8333246.1 hypothetical protein [Bacteroidales bacterium]